MVATGAAALAVHWLVAWLGSHGLGIFGWWRIVLSALLLAGILSGRLTITAPPDLENVNPKTLTPQKPKNKKHLHKKHAEAPMVERGMDLGPLREWN